MGSYILLFFKRVLLIVYLLNFWNGYNPFILLTDVKYDVYVMETILVFFYFFIYLKCLSVT